MPSKSKNIFKGEGSVETNRSKHNECTQHRPQLDRWKMQERGGGSNGRMVGSVDRERTSVRLYRAALAVAEAVLELALVSIAVCMAVSA